MQAVAVLVVITIIGLSISAVQLRYALGEQRQDAVDLTNDILTLAEGGATTAAWTLDNRLANDVVYSIVALHGVSYAELADEHGTVLARAERAAPERGVFSNWFADTFIFEAATANTELTVAAANNPRVVGNLSVKLDVAHLAESFLGHAVTTVALTLIQAFLVGLLLLWLSSKLVTDPLKRVAQRIAEVDPHKPDQGAMTVPAFHRANELGYLIGHTNKMLERLAQSQTQLRRLATRDSLTGLPNRAVVNEALENALSRAARNKTLVAVVFLDIDRFKFINDSLGHDLGDELLKAAAKKLTDTVRAKDFVGRLGGDEFLIILEDVRDPAEVRQTLDRISESLSESYKLSDHHVRAPGSLGISLFPNDSDDPGVLMRQADLAMYKAKESGGATWRFFSKDMSDIVESRQRLEVALDGALARNEFELLFQPKFWVRSGELAGCEALLRWRHNGELMSASQFISVAEDTGIILKIGDWVLEEVCAQIEEWNDRYFPVPIAINVSAIQLRGAGFVARVMKMLNRYHLEPRLLELEITETVLMGSLSPDFEMLDKLRRRGVAISVDDFGTGYSSLSYLTRLPVSSLKIDRSFVSGQRRSRVVLSTIVAMSKALGLRTIAEGVETQKQYDTLLLEGCDVLQGYLTGAPVTREEFEKLYLQPVQDKPLTEIARTHALHVREQGHA